MKIAQYGDTMSSDYIYKMLGSSPIRPLQQHMALTLSCAGELIPFFAAALINDTETAQLHYLAIIKLKAEADTLKRQLRLQLPKGKFLPISRRDLLGLLAMQDRLSNRSREICSIIFERNMIIPEAMGDSMLAFINASVSAPIRAKEIVDEFDTLLNNGTGGPELRMAKKLIRTLNDIEDKTDPLHTNARSLLFQCEQSMTPLNAMYFYKILNLIGELTDITQRIGSRLQLMLSK